MLGLSSHLHLAISRSIIGQFFTESLEGQAETSSIYLLPYRLVNSVAAMHTTESDALLPPPPPHTPSYPYLGQFLTESLEIQADTSSIGLLIYCLVHSVAAMHATEHNALLTPPPHTPSYSYLSQFLTESLEIPADTSSISLLIHCLVHSVIAMHATKYDALLPPSPPHTSSYP